eukprot:1940059-Rhodomonas_salina.2
MPHRMLGPSAISRLLAPTFILVFFGFDGVSGRHFIVSSKSNLTLATALDDVAPGDVIDIAPGRYTGEGFCKLRISVYNVTIRGHGPELTKIDCFASGGRHLYIDASHVRISQIHFSNGTCFGDANCPGPGDGGALLNHLRPSERAWRGDLDFERGGLYVA